MKSNFPVIAAICIAAFALSVSAKDKNSPTPSSSPSATAAANAGKAIGFHGKVASVDITKKTFVVGKRTFQVTAQTAISDQGKPAKVSDIVPVEEVSGSYWKQSNGTLVAKMIKIGAKTPDDTPGAAAEKKQRSEVAVPDASPK